LLNDPLLSKGNNQFTQIHGYAEEEKGPSKSDAQKDQKALEIIKGIKKFNSRAEFDQRIKELGDIMKRHVNNHQGADEMVKENEFNILFWNRDRDNRDNIRDRWDWGEFVKLNFSVKCEEAKQLSETMIDMVEVFMNSGIKGNEGDKIYFPLIIPKN